MVNRSGSTRCSRTSWASTGRNVPGPTCRTSSARSTPRSRRRSSRAGVKWRPGGRGGHGACLAGVDRLVALPVRRRVGPADVGRQGHVAVALEGRVGVEAVEEEADAAQGGRRGAIARPPASPPRGPRCARAGRGRRRRRPPAAGGGRDAPSPPRGPRSWRRTSRISASPPPGRRPRSRAGKTRLRFVTRRSPGRRSSGRSAKARCSRAPVDALEHEQPRGVALGERLLGNQLGRELEVVRAELVVRGGLGHRLRTASSGGWPRARCRARAGRGARRRGASPCAPGGCGRESRAGGGTARRCPRSRRAPR